MSDSFLTDAGSLFFAAWMLVVAAVSYVAFRSDLLPHRSPSTETLRARSAAGKTNP